VEFAMSERDTFGPRLRRERERRGISLETIATRTNVSLELWQGFESNDYSRWPTGLFARAFVRDYAKAVGLDPVEVVDDFCRLFPLGDRRVLPIIRAQAELIGHDTTLTDDPSLMPNGIDRRGQPAAPAPSAPAAPKLRLVPRLFRAIFS
jgi:transcriptional regulator with XRE-family HTH domain